MTVEDCCAFLTTQGRDTVLATIVELLQLVHGMDKSGMVPDQHGNALMALGRVRDLSGLEMSEHAAELNKSEACVDWGSVSTQDWIRHQCHQPSGTAADLLHVGEQLANLPKTIAAVRDGSIGFAHAAIIARHAQAITHSHSAEPFDEAPFLRAARESSVSRLWYYSMHAWHRADPDGVADEQRQAAERRYLRLTDGDDGTLYVKGEFDSAAGATIRTALEPLAQPHGDGDDRGREHRNADALVELAGHCLDTAAVPQHGSVRPHVQVTTTLETLQGLIGAPAGEMALSVPISAKTVQRIACDSSVTRVLLGTDSAVVDAGRAKRVVSGGSRRLLDARDQALALVAHAFHRCGLAQDALERGQQHVAARVERLHVKAALARQALPLARLRAPGLLELRTPCHPLGAGWQDRSFEHDSALPAPSLDGP